MVNSDDAQELLEVSEFPLALDMLRGLSLVSEIYPGPPIPGTFSNIYMHGFGDSAFKELRAVPTDRHLIKSAISVSNRLWTIMTYLSSHHILVNRCLRTNWGPCGRPCPIQTSSRC